MKKIFILALATLIVSNLFAQQEKRIETSKQLLSAFQKNSFEKIILKFDANMKTALPKEKMAEIWTSLEKQCGAFVKSDEITTDKYQSYDIVYILLEFKNTKLKMKTVFDTQGLIAGLFFVPENQK